MKNFRQPENALKIGVKFWQNSKTWECDLLNQT